MYWPVVAGAVTLKVPEVASVPDQPSLPVPPEAAQLLALVDDHTRLATWPGCTVEGVTTRFTVGAGTGPTDTDVVPVPVPLVSTQLSE